MQERIDILGVRIDTVRFDKLFNKTQTYLNEEAFHSIYFVGMKTVLAAESNQEFVEQLEQCDFLIAAERTIEEKIYGSRNYSSKERMLMAARYLERILIKMNKNKLNLYLIGNEQEQIEQLLKSLQQGYSDIQCYCSCIEEETKEEAMDFLVNDINVVAPDVIILLMAGPQAMEFLRENRSRINAKLCLCVGEAEEEVLKEIGIELEIPTWITYCHLESLYRRIFHNYNVSNTILKKMFQKKMKQQQLKEEKEKKE